MDPLRHCPVCRYCLEGLPDQHVCPECAFEYDKQMRVYDQSPRLAILLGAFIAIGIFLTVVDPRKIGTPWGVLNLIAMLWWSGWYVSRYTFKKRNRGIVGPDALLFFAGGALAEKIRQNDISSIRLLARSAEIRLLTGHKPIRIGDEFFGSHQRLREFCNRAQQVYALPPVADEPGQQPKGEKV